MPIGLQMFLFLVAFVCFQTLYLSSGSGMVDFITFQIIIFNWKMDLSYRLENTKIFKDFFFSLMTWYVSCLVNWEV